MTDNGPGVETMPKIKELPPKERAISILHEALSGVSPKSKNSLIKDAIKVLEA